MTAASGDPGETPQNAGQQQPLGGYEAPGQHGYQPSQEGFPPPPPPGQYGQPASGFPPPGYGSPAAPGYGSYPPPPPGYAPPGYAPPTQYGPEYGSPYPGDYGYPAAAPGGTNTLAVTSLVASIVGLLCGIGSIIGIVSGVVALNQVKRTREGGHGLAIAGIVIGVASLVISVVWMTFAWR